MTDKWQPKEGDEVWWWSTNYDMPLKSRWNKFPKMEFRLARGELFPTQEACQADHERRFNGCRWTHFPGDMYYETGCDSEAFAADYLNPEEDNEVNYCPNCGGRITTESDDE